jgi:hypothetical protein
VYLEPLPEQCPPDDAEDKNYDEVWRTLPSIPPTDQHFYSKAKAGDALPPDLDPCRFASCSLYTSRVPASKMLKFPKFQGGTVAKIRIPMKAGLSKKKKQHVDFWAFRHFKFLDSILEVEDGKTN